MTEHEDQPPQSRGTLRDEAAEWFAVMRGPEAAARHDDFQRWLGASAFHLEAYNRVAETFSLGKALKHGTPAAPASRLGTPGGQTSARGGWAMASAAALLVALLSGAWTMLPRHAAQRQKASIAATIGSERSPGQLEIRTKVGEIKQFRLADGSVATLDTDSLVLASLGDKARELTLLKGRARFEVAHEARPFLVSAGGGTIKAVGTIFDVALLARGRVDVRLFRGAVDVAVQRDTSRGAHKRRLMPGEVLSFSGKGAFEVSSLTPSADARWPDGLRDFNGAPLQRVLAEANRYSNVELRAASAEVADIRISGTFRVDNVPVLAENIAEVLGLARIASGNAIVLTRACPPASQKICSPPS